MLLVGVMSRSVATGGIGGYAEALAHLKPPYWWTYSSRRLEEDLVVSVEGVADVVGSSWGAAWQMITGDKNLNTSIPVEEVLNR